MTKSSSNSHIIETEQYQVHRQETNIKMIKSNPQSYPLKLTLVVAVAVITLLASLTQAYYLSAEPQITPFYFSQNVQEEQRISVLCTISSGDLPVMIHWLKDGQHLTTKLATEKNIHIKPEVESSILKLYPVRLEHAGNYTCIVKNRAGSQAHTAQLVVRAKPRWVKEPQLDPIVATRGQTVVIDCQSTGWPKPNQTWQMKTYTQREFGSVPATGRISLAANGSLVIRNADKSDEANYLCKSSNGIGDGISWSTSLKITVPAHFEQTSKQQTNVVRKHNQVQLRCDAYGDEPISIEWFKNNQRLTNELDSRYSINNKTLANGVVSVLHIKQTQRQDNSIYECHTENKVGKDRLPIELLVQEEPDSILDLQATHFNSRSVTLMWTEPYDGRSPISSYMFQYKKVQQHEANAAASGAATATLMGASSTSSGLMSSDMDFASSASAMPVLESGDGLSSSSGKASLSSSSSGAEDEWLGSVTRIMPAASTGANGAAAAGNNVKSITIEKLDPASKYVLRALAINALGSSKYSHPLDFITEEEVPSVGPTNIRAKALNSTSIQVSWDELPKTRQLGRIHGYYIGYRLASNLSSSSYEANQHFVYKPYIITTTDHGSAASQQQQQENQHQQQQQRLDSVIHDLRRDTAYEITVVAFNSRGSGPSSDMVLCKTIEMEPPKPVKLYVRLETNESIFIEWQRDPQDQNPVDDYELYQEKNSASKEWLQVRLPGNQTQYKAPGLKCGTRYQFYIIAHNKVGNSGPSEVVSASTSGTLPVIPTKNNLLKMINSTCLLVNLNSFQNNGCRKTFTLRYRLEKGGSGSSSSNSSLHHPHHHQQQHPMMMMMNGGSGTSTSQLVGIDGLLATASKLSSANAAGSVTASATTAAAGTNSLIVASGGQSSSSTSPSEWITIRPKKHQRFNEEDRMEYLCDLNPYGEYTIHVTASNDVGRSEAEYSVLMSSDELRESYFKELLEYFHQLPNVLSYIPSIFLCLLVGFCLSLLIIVLEATAINHYQKFVIWRNQIRATHRAKQDEKRRRKLNSAKLQSQKQLELWVDEFEEEEGEDGDDEEDEDQSSSSSNAGNANLTSAAHRNPHRFSTTLPQGHYISNISNSAFDTCSIDTNPCNKFSSGSCHSTASTDSIHGRFQCLNSKQYVKMNEYTMLPPIANRCTPPEDFYGTARPTIATLNDQNSLYYSTLRRSSMQTYLPQQRQAQPPPSQQQQHHQQQQHQQQLQQQQQQQLGRRGHNSSDIYGYYMSPQGSRSIQQVNNTSASSSHAHQVAVNEAANSIFVPPQKIIYTTAPDMRHQPVFL